MGSDVKAIFIVLYIGFRGENHLHSSTYVKKKTEKRKKKRRSVHVKQNGHMRTVIKKNVSECHLTHSRRQFGKFIL